MARDARRPLYPWRVAESRHRRADLSGRRTRPPVAVRATGAPDRRGEAGLSEVGQQFLDQLHAIGPRAWIERRQLRARGRAVSALRRIARALPGAVDRERVGWRESPRLRD